MYEMNSGYTFLNVLNITCNSINFFDNICWHPNQSSRQSPEHQNDQTQKQFLSPSSPSHEHLTLNVEHTTLLYNYLFSTHTYFFISICTMSDLFTHNCLYCILYFCHIVHCLFVYCPFAVCVLSCHSVALWSFCHYNKLLVCGNIPGQ